MASRELLALRREVLVARASLQRATIAREVEELRGSLRWPQAAASIAASPLARSLAFGALVLVVGRGRLARLVRLAAAAVGALKLASALARRKGGQGEIV